MENNFNRFIFSILIVIISLCFFVAPIVIAAEKTIRLKGINALLAPEKNFNGVEALNLNEDGGNGWHTDYVLRRTGNDIEIGYCEYFSPYVDKMYGDITVNLGDYTFSLDNVGKEGFKLDKNGLRIVCDKGQKCITNKFETSRTDIKGKSIPDTFQKITVTFSEVVLYFVDKDKQQKVLEEFQKLF